MSDSIRSRSRSPLKKSSDKFLFIGNIPPTWHFSQVNQFLKNKIKQEKYTSQISFIHMLKQDNELKGNCVVEFHSAAACKEAERILTNEEIDGKMLIIEPNAGDRIRHKTRKIRDRAKMYLERMNKAEERDPDIFRNHETYGLSAKFLTDLGLTPPLTNRIYIADLSPNVTETKLREVFRYAGNVVSANIQNNKNDNKIGKVLFDHPVEAVQAISMFNNKELYGMTMMVKQDKYKNSLILPEGLSSIGMGLGQDGTPMMGVRHTIEMEPLKKLLLNELKNIQNKNPIHNQSDSDNNPNQSQNNPMWNNNQTNDNNAGNPSNNLMQMLQQSISGNIGSLGLVLQQAMLSQMQNQNAFGNVPDQTAFGVQNSVNQAFGNQNVPNQAFGNQNVPTQAFGNQNVPTQAFVNQNVANQAFGNPVANENAFGNQAAQPQSRFDIPPNALTLVQNAIRNPNDLVQQVQQLSYQNSSMWQTPQAPKSRFDIPPSGVAGPVNAAQIWNSGNWSQTQTPSHASTNDRSDTSYGGPKIKPDEFDVPRLSDAKKSEKTSDMLLFTNLPSSVTSQALVNKMTEVGPLKFAEITGPERAIVRFQQSRDADRCLKLYDRSKVDGQIISVKYV